MLQLIANPFKTCFNLKIDSPFKEGECLCNPMFYIEYFNFTVLLSKFEI